MILLALELLDKILDRLLARHVSGQSDQLSIHTLGMLLDRLLEDVLSSTRDVWWSSEWRQVSLDLFAPVGASEYLQTFAPPVIKAWAHMSPIPVPLADVTDTQTISTRLDAKETKAGWLTLR
jgi:hypothetical protein